MTPNPTPTDFAPGLLEYRQDYGNTAVTALAENWMLDLDRMTAAATPGTPSLAALYSLRDSLTASLLAALATPLETPGE